MSFTTRFFFLSALATITASISAQTPDQRAVTTFLKPLIERQIFSGSVVVTKNGRIIAEQHGGMANRELRVPITAATRFYVASVTKSFTAAGILMLRDAGALSLDDKIGKFIEGFSHGEVTIRQLLTHTSGFQHPVFYPDFYDLAKKSYTTAEAVELFKDRGEVGPAGAQRRYSDYNYILLARIIELVSKKSYGEFVEGRMFRPLGLSTAGNHSSWARIIPNRAVGYQPLGIREFENARYFDYSISTGAGSLYMSAEDLSRWIAALGEERLLGKQSTVELLGSSDHDGILHGRSIAGHRAIELTGWDNVGFTTDALYFPDAKLSVTVTANVNDSGIASFVSEAIAESVFTGRVLAPLRFLEHAPDVDRYVGVFKMGADFYVPGQEIALAKVGDQLCERQQNPDRLMGLIPMADGSFMYRSHSSRVTFQEQGGKVVGMTFDGFKAMKLR